MALKLLMTAVAKGRRLCLLTLAKPNFFCFLKLYLYTSERHTFYLFV